MTVLLSRFKAKGMSYHAVARSMKPAMDASGVFRAIKTPWRTTIETYTAIAAFVGMPADEAAREWAKMKTAYQTNKIKAEARARK